MTKKKDVTLFKAFFPYWFEAIDGRLITDEKIFDQFKVFSRLRSSFNMSNDYKNELAREKL